MSNNNSAEKESNVEKSEMKQKSPLLQIYEFICFPCCRWWTATRDTDRAERDIEKMLPSNFTKSDCPTLPDASNTQTPMTLVAYAEMSRNCQKRTSGSVCEDN